MSAIESTTVLAAQARLEQARLALARLTQERNDAVAIANEGGVTYTTLSGWLQSKEQNIGGWCRESRDRRNVSSRRPSGGVDQ